MQFKDVAEIRQANKNSGYYFFDPKTMRFFATKVHAGVYGGRYFITSENAGPFDKQRVFVVREAHANGRVTTANDTRFRSLELAREIAKKMAKKINPD